MTRKVLVYCSKDQADWMKAQTILKENRIEMTAWHSEEPSVAGCGAKIDIRGFGRKTPVPKELYKIEVARSDCGRAEEVLKDRVQPVRHYGVG